MKTTILSGVLALVTTLGSVHVTNAQCSDYKWPEGEAKAKAEESIVLLKDNKDSSPKGAIPPLNWLITNAPALNKAIYIYGADAYDALAKKETDATKKATYADSLVAIYDLRAKNTPCDEVASIENRKALAAYPYYINSGKAKDLMQIMDKTLELNGVNTMDPTLVPYMQTVQVNLVNLKTLTPEEAIERYDKITEVIENKIKKAQSQGKPIDKYKQYQQQVDDIFSSLPITLDCAQIKKNLEPKFRANPQDTELAKRIFKLMLQGKCTDDPLWLETGEVVVGAEPDFAILKNLGIRYLSQENFEKAEDYLKKALPLAPANSDKADILIYLGGVEARKGSKSQAREMYRQALAADPSRKEAYEKIGDLYMGSFDDCKQEESMADDRKVFLIAYDYYVKAGESGKAAQAKKQFPSGEEIFERNYQEGTSTRVECWINESTTWRTR